jgi:hypothetical protein
LSASRRLSLFLLVATLAVACTSQQSSEGEPPSQAPSSQAPATVGGPGAPVRGSPHPVGAKWDWSRVDQFTPYLRELSGGSTFYIVVWCDVERERGQRDWSQVDNVVRSTRALGYTLLLKIRTGSCWATGGQRGSVRGIRQKSASAMPEDTGAYQEFVREVVRRYSDQDVHDYAIENEPNARRFFWDGTGQEYERLVTIGASTIRSVDPRARVLDGGLASTVYGTGIADHLLRRGSEGEAVAAYDRYYARRTNRRGKPLPQVTNAGDLRAALDTPESRRNLEMLDATLRLAKHKVIDAFQLHFYESWENLPALLAYLHDVLPPSFPIEAWELGMFWPGGPDDERVRADEVTKAVVTLLAGGVRRIIWLPLAYNPLAADERGEIRYGLLNPDGEVRLAGTALQRVAEAADGASWHPVSSQQVTGIGFGRGRKSTLLLWSDEGVELSATQRTGVQVQRMDGSQLPQAPAGLRLTSEPVLVTVTTSLKDAPRVLGIQ